MQYSGRVSGRLMPFARKMASDERLFHVFFQTIFHRRMRIGSRREKSALTQKNSAICFQTK